jgi:predicted RND superfamily exporter protein
MVLLGLSINMMTLVALLMAIGIVMDDAIVITDSVAPHAREETSGLAAVVSGTRQVLPGVVSSFLTTVVVFAPLSFLAGELGAVLEVLPIVLIAALAVSLVEAFLILPHHLKGPIERVRDDPGLAVAPRHRPQLRLGARACRRHGRGPGGALALWRDRHSARGAAGHRRVHGRRPHRPRGHPGHRRRCARSAHPHAPGHAH